MQWCELLILQPELKLADPICTYVFSVLVLVTTVRIIRDTVVIVLEGESLVLRFSGFILGVFSGLAE